MMRLRRCDIGALAWDIYGEVLTKELPSIATISVLGRDWLQRGRYRFRRRSLCRGVLSQYVGRDVAGTAGESLPLASTAIRREDLLLMGELKGASMLCGTCHWWQGSQAPMYHCSLTSQ